MWENSAGARDRIGFFETELKQQKQEDRVLSLSKLILIKALESNRQKPAQSN